MRHDSYNIFCPGTIVICSFLIISCLNLIGVDGLICYQCLTYNDEIDCPSNSNYQDDCPQDSRNHSRNDDFIPVCIKYQFLIRIPVITNSNDVITEKKMYKPRTQYSCGEAKKTESDICISKGKYTHSETTCTCSKDKCNKGTSVHFHHLAFSFSIVLTYINFD